jgi:hypothetical protein
MRTIGFSGSRDLSEEEEVSVERILHSLYGDAVVTGACIGIDEFIAVWFLHHRPNMTQKIFVPADRSRVNMRFIDMMLLQKRVEVHFMPPGTSYAQRNYEIVENSDSLVAFPRERESHPKSTRSGTWQTIRKARNSGKMAKVYVLSNLTTAV